MSVPFRLMTANLFDGNVDPDSLARVLSEVEPDIMVCQELATNAAEVIADHFLHHDLHPGGGYQGRGIASRFDFLAGVLWLPTRRASLATFAPDVHPAIPDGLHVIGTHLVNPIDRPLRLSAKIRHDQVTGLLEQVKLTQNPVVVAGDLNATPLYPSYRRLAGALTDMPKSVGPVRTWSPWPKFPRLLRIDHIFSNGLVCTAVRRVEVKGGDHSLLVTDLRTSP